MTILKKLLIIPILGLFMFMFSAGAVGVFAQYDTGTQDVTIVPADPPPTDTTVYGYEAPNTTAAVNAALAAGATNEQAAQAGIDSLAGSGYTGTISFQTTNLQTNPDGSTQINTVSVITFTGPGGIDCGNYVIIFSVTPIEYVPPSTPSGEPTPGPSGEPTPGPSGEPTPGPTGEPTPGPSAPPVPDCSLTGTCDGGGGGDEPPPPVVSSNDLSIAVKWGNQTQYNPNSTANLTFTVTNGGTSAVSTIVGFWPRGGVGANSLPNCPFSGGVPVSIQPVSLNPSESKDVTFGFNVGGSGATAYAYVSYLCNPSEIGWGNNQAAQSYVVDTAAWFESINGDVGSQGSVSVTQTPPLGRYQSSFLLVGESIDSKVKTEKWRISNYTSQLVPAGGVYTYLAERFLATAKKTPGNGCNIPSGNTNGYNYCSGDATFNAGGPPNGNGVWFIDGNLTIQNDLALAAGDTMTFIVRGNITVNTSVKRVDGIYVAGGTFNDADASGDMGVQLVVNGGVYAQGVNLARTLGGAACPSGAACDNAQTPADQFVFDPRYLVGLNNVLGTPKISWTETAP